tara:strand:+ start:13116 stop:13970 length:855 start_codon:yes stop_codon:yes gene_type:complete
MRLALIGKVFMYLLLALVLLIAGYLILMSGIFHTPQSVHEFSSDNPDYQRVLVVGGTKGTGLEVVRQLHEKGERVTAMVRKTSNTDALDEMGIDKVVADAMRPEELAQAITAGRFDALVSTLGTSARDLPQRQNFIQSLFKGQTVMDPNKRPDFIGNKNVFDAARAAGIERVVFVTVIGPGKSWEGLPLPARRGHQEVIPLKEQAEDYLMELDMDYTIIRPGGLSNGSMTKTAKLTTDPESFSYMGRKDLAELVVNSLDDDSTIKQVYTAYDPNRLYLWNLFLD